jgi:hypothetical protein
MTEHDKGKIDDILHGEGDWFTAHLFRLIAKADNNNRKKLYWAFPSAVQFVHEHLTGKAFGTSEDGEKRHK